MAASQPDIPAWTREDFVRELVLVPGVARDLVERWAELDEPGRLELVRELNSDADTVGGESPPDELSPRELEAVAAIVEQGSASGAAQALGLSESTVGAQLESVLKKLKLRTRTHAVAILLRDGLLAAASDPDEDLDDEDD
jgi:DNA-binding NarL/FixJ family response regulator